MDESTYIFEMIKYSLMWVGGIALLVLLHKWYSKKRERIIYSENTQNSPVKKTLALKIELYHWHFIVPIILFLQHFIGVLTFMSVDADSFPKLLMDAPFFMFMMGLVLGAFFFLYFLGEATKSVKSSNTKKKRFFALLYAFIIFVSFCLYMAYPK